MLDMAFQILAFFVFTYNPSAVEGQFPISLAQGETAGDKENKKTDEKVATTEGIFNIYTVILKTSY